MSKSSLSNTLPTITIAQKEQVLVMVLVVSVSTDGWQGQLSQATSRAAQLACRLKLLETGGGILRLLRRMGMSDLKLLRIVGHHQELIISGFMWFLVSTRKKREEFRLMILLLLAARQELLDLHHPIATCNREDQPHPEVLFLLLRVAMCQQARVHGVLPLR